MFFLPPLSLFCFPEPVPPRPEGMPLDMKERPVPQESPMESQRITAGSLLRLFALLLGRFDQWHER